MNKIAFAIAMSFLVCNMTSHAAMAQDAPKSDEPPAFTTAEIETLLKGRTLYVTDEMGRSAGNVVRMFFDPNGTVKAASSSGMSNRGPYTIADDKLCYEWDDKRWGTNWCFRIMKEAETVRFITNRGPKWTVKSFEDGNPNNL